MIAIFFGSLTIYQTARILTYTDQFYVYASVILISLVTYHLGFKAGEKSNEN